MEVKVRLSCDEVKKAILIYTIQELYIANAKLAVVDINLDGQWKVVSDHDEGYMEVTLET